MDRRHSQGGPFAGSMALDNQPMASILCLSSRAQPQEICLKPKTPWKSAPVPFDPPFRLFGLSRLFLSVSMYQRRKTGHSGSGIYGDDPFVSKIGFLLRGHLTRVEGSCCVRHTNPCLRVEYPVFEHARMPSSQCIGIELTDYQEHHETVFQTVWTSIEVKSGNSRQ